jgi:putative ABC transport system permease protein
MLFKISIKNIRKSFKDYAIYFFTLILGVAVFYVFNAIDSQTVMLKVNSSVYEIIKLMTDILSGVSVFVSFILGFLIIYASRFLIKRRNKEFGIYMILGMGKRKISLILFFETMLIGVISLAVGIVLGTVASQFMSVIVANMFDADMTGFRFIFSSEACVKTIVYFAIMYVLVMLFNTFSISKCRLIDLLNAGKKNEKITMKNPLICTFVFVIAVGLLSYAYWLVTSGAFKLNVMDKLWLPVGLGCVATFLIFWSVSGLLIKIFTGIKSVYYKGVNSFVLRQFGSKINTMVFSITVICLMLFITISVLAGALSMKDSLKKSLSECAPVDMQVRLKYSDEADASDADRICRLLTDNGFDTDTYLKDITAYNMYRTGLTAADTLGEYADILISTNPLVDLSGQELFMKLSDYNRVAGLYGLQQHSLNEDEYIVIANYKYMVDIRNAALKNGQTIAVGEKTYRPRYSECMDGFVTISAQRINDGIFVLPDDAFDDSRLYITGISANYKSGDKAWKNSADNKLVDTVMLINKKNSQSMDSDDSETSGGVGSLVNCETKGGIAQNGVGLGALVTFIALYLGIIFLISSAAILALKELSDSADNKERYGMLRKIGVDERMIDMALLRQIGIFFAFPLLLAVIHSIFGLKFVNLILSTMGMSSMMASVGTTAVFLVLIYGGYFVLTYICSRGIIKNG